MFFGLTFLLLAAAWFVFWIWMLVECLTREAGTEKIAWLIALIFLPVVGTLLYFFIRHPINKFPPHVQHRLRNR